MKASANFFRIAFVAFVFVSMFMQDAAATGRSGPDKKKGISYVLTSLHLTPRQFAKAYRSEKKENSRINERSHRKMMQKQHGWNIFQYRSENHHEANHTHF
jgi:hypothetical protein